MKYIKKFKENKITTKISDDFFTDIKDICREIEDNGFECKIGSMFDNDKITIKIKPIVEYIGLEEGPKHGFVDFYADDIDIDILERLVDYVKSFFPNSEELIRVELLQGLTFPLKLDTYFKYTSQEKSKFKNNPIRSLSLVINLNI